MKTTLYKLREPFVFEDRTYTEINLDFGALRGREMIAVEDGMEAAGKSIYGLEFSAEFAGRLAARASKVPFEVLVELPFRDFSNIRSITRNFILFGQAPSQADVENVPEE